MLLTLTQIAFALKGTYSIANASDKNIKPYLMFGFENGGTLELNFSYSTTKSDIVLLLCSKEIINSSLGSNFDVMSFFKMLIGEKKDNTEDISIIVSEWK